MTKGRVYYSYIPKICKTCSTWSQLTRVTCLVLVNVLASPYFSTTIEVNWFLKMITLLVW